MKRVSWLHTADLHLGKPIEHWKGSHEDYIKRKEEYRKTFQRMIDIVKKRSLPFLFIAGDFLEHGYVSRSLWDFVMEQFAQIPKTEVWIAPGNHDPYRHDSVYKKEKWPDHVHIFGSHWEVHPYSEYNLTIIGKGFADFHEKEGSLPEVSSHGRSIMVVHGDFMTKKNKSDYFPIWENRLRLLGLNYVALGHVHQAYSRILDNEKNTYVRYPGSPEALSWKETKERTVTIGEFSDDDRQIEILPIHTKTYEQHSVQLISISTKENLLSEVLNALESKDKQSYHLVRLTGWIAPGWQVEEELPWIILKLRENGYEHVYIEDYSLPDFDLDRLRKQSNVIATFIELMEERMTQEVDEQEKSLIQSALYKGLEAIYFRGNS